MNVKSVLVAFMVALALTSARAARTVVPLDGTWTLTESDGRTCAVEVPHAWNIMDGADGEGVMSVEKWKKNSSCASSYERKRVTYSRPLPDPKSDRRYFIRCEGASITATVRVNGKTAGSHVGAFTAFCFEVTDLLKPSGNVLEIDVDNFVRDDSPPVNADFTMYGGLCRHVSLIETPKVCIDPTRDGGSGLWFLPNPESGEVEVRVAVNGAPDEVRRFKVNGFRLWSPETPIVYTQTVSIASGDAVTGTFGFRKAEFRDEGFYLNGVRRKLRGVNYHQDREGKGWAVSDADREADIREIREMGADAVRTAHYPHSDFTYDLCDRAGLAVWCEHPNVNGLRFTEAFRSNAWRQAREMVVQLRNHPSIVCWSIFNELYNKVKMTEGEPESMMEEFRDHVKGLDPTRAVAAASDRPEKARLNAIPEALGFNRYPYWYDDRNSMRMLTDAIFAANPGRRSIAIAEYGAGGSCGQHGDAGTPCVYNGDFHSEEYEAYVHALDYRDIAADGRLWGSFVWCMYDFGSDCRLEGARHGLNDKGLVSFDRRIRKEAWWLYRAAWSQEPVLHLVGKNWEATTNAVATVLAFSNRDEVRLTVNGRQYPAQRPEAGSVIWKGIPLEFGNNVIEIAADGLSERAVWTRMRSPNYDPAKIGTYTLEDPLTFADGRKVRDAADWEKRRLEIRGMFEREMYGRIPGAPAELVTEKIDEGVTMGGYAVRRQVSMWFRKDRSGPRIDWLVLLPRHVKGPVPAILFLNYGGNHELLPDTAIRIPECWLRPSADFRRAGNRATAATRGLYADPSLRTVYPVGTLLSRGYAVATACHGEVSPDPYGQELTGRYAPSDVLSLFPYDPAREDNPTTLGAWAWALMRGMDLLEREPGIDAKRVAVTGSSRLGKAALIAGAFDSRFWAVAPNQTGGGGVPLMKRNYGEDAEALARIFPHWFCKAFRKWVDREKERPMDQHLLLAMVAPRKLLVEGFCDPLYDTEGEYLSARAASCAWRFLGGAGLPEVAFPDPYDTSAIGTDVGYYRRTEKHGISAYDWTRLLEFLDRNRTPGTRLAYQLDISRNKVPRMEGLHRLVDILADLGYDELQLYVEHTFAYSKHETVWKGHSPVTAEEIRELDAHCARRGIDLVPNQNSFGHMHNWLRHPAYLSLAESPKGVRIEKPKIEMSFSALCATDPKSFEFLAGLYDELLPNFRSRHFNVGCDEVWDILDPRARSAAKVKEIGETGVYLNYLNELDRMVRTRGRTMMYWADMALRHPETLNRLPKDAIALIWGYEKSHPFARQCAQIRGAGLPFSVCPSTSAWGSVFGRWSNARANIDAAFAAAGSYGARGVFVADWGDGGHPQPWIVSLPGVVYASAVRRGLHPDDRELAGMIDRVAGATCGEALLGIGNAYLNCCAEEGGNSHHLFKILRQGRRFVRPKDMTDDRLRATFDAIRAARVKAGLDKAPDWVKDDFATLDLLAELCEQRAFGRFEESLSPEREARYRELWLRQNRPGGLDESVSQVFRK